MFTKYKTKKKRVNINYFEDCLVIDCAFFFLFFSNKKQCKKCLINVYSYYKLQNRNLKTIDYNPKNKVRNRNTVVSKLQYTYKFIVRC